MQSQACITTAPGITAPDLGDTCRLIGPRHQLPFPYADLSNPQTLNLYSYGKNNPTTIADKDGHCPSDDCKRVQVTVSTPEPNVVQNVPAGKVYASGVGVQPVITFTDKKGNPMPGVQVKESPKTVDNLTGQPVKSNANSGTVTTSANGTIKDNVVAPLRLD